MEYNGSKSFLKPPKKDSLPFACMAMLILDTNTANAYLPQDYGNDSEII